MFQGHSVCSLDTKSRLMLPTKFRKFMKPEADNKLVLTRGLDECLLLYPLDEWEKVKMGLMSYNQFNAEQRFFIRQFLSLVNEVELDSQNRILIPPQLMQFAKLKKEVIVLGLLDKMEIWDPDIKEKMEKPFKEAFIPILQEIEMALGDFRRSSGIDAAKIILSGGAAAASSTVVASATIGSRLSRATAARATSFRCGSAIPVLSLPNT